MKGILQTAVRPESAAFCLRASAGALTQQVTGEVHRQDDAHGEDADDDQQADDVALEGQVVHGVLAALLTDLLVPEASMKETDLRPSDQTFPKQREAGGLLRARLTLF